MFEGFEVAEDIFAAHVLDGVLHVVRAENGAPEPRFPPRPLR